MRHDLRAFAGLLLALSVTASAHAEILIRWDQEQIPSPESLGIATVVIPARNSAAVKSALAQGYRLYLEVEASTMATLTPIEGVAGVIVKGNASSKQLALLRQRLKSPAARVLVLETRGKWPHIRSNWVTKVPQDGPRAASQPSARSSDVLQVTRRSAQPWIENNAALLRIVHAEQPGSTPLLTYPWTPITLAEADEGPALENYLVAIAEAGSFGGDLLLPLHERFQRSLLLGHPQARADWNEIRRYVDFYAWNLPRRYQPIANVGVVTAEPMLSYEVMNLLTRHNLAFALIAPSELPSRALADFKLLIVLDEPHGAQLATLADFERKGGKVARAPKGVVDPNRFALEMRQLLGPDQRPVDIWNGITVLTAPFSGPDGTLTLLTVLNYAHQPLPVQLRVAGTYSRVHYESPEEPAELLPHQHRGGFTELVLPALRIGGRVFLTREPSR